MVIEITSVSSHSWFGRRNHLYNRAVGDAAAYLTTASESVLPFLIFLNINRSLKYVNQIMSFFAFFEDKSGLLLSSIIQFINRKADNGIDISFWRK